MMLYLSDDVYREKTLAKILAMMKHYPLRQLCDQDLPDYFIGHLPRFLEQKRMIESYCKLDRTATVFDCCTAFPFISWYCNWLFECKVEFGCLDMEDCELAPGIEGYRFNIIDHQLPVKQYSLVIMTEALEHIPADLYAIRDKLIASVKPGGHLLVSYPIGGRNAGHYEADLPQYDHGKTHAHLREFTAESAEAFIDLPVVEKHRVETPLYPDGILEFLYRTEPTRILWVGAASPFAPTAYGKISYYIPKELEKMGYNVHILSPHNPQGRLVIDGLKLYPNLIGTRLCLDQVVRLYRDLKCELCIYMGDFWPYASSLGDLAKTIPLVLHSPIDHFPLVESEIRCLQAVRQLASVGAAGMRWALEAGLTNVSYAPHGVNPEIFRPGDRVEARKKLGWPPDAFIYITVATNKGDRKNLCGLLRAYRDVLSRRPELAARTRLMLHTYPYRDELNEEGYDIWNLAISMGLRDNIIFTDPLTYLEGIPESQLALMYQASDVHVLPSKTEGFGIPLIEAGACGIPSITTNFASMPEVVGDCGWLIDVNEMEVQQLVGYSWQSIPSTAHLAQLLEYVVDHPEEVRDKGLNMMQRVEEEYTWKKAASYWPEILNKSLLAIQQNI